MWICDLDKVKIMKKSSLRKRTFQAPKGSQTHDHPNTSWNALITELWVTRGEWWDRMWLRQDITQWLECSSLCLDGHGFYSPLGLGKIFFQYLTREHFFIIWFVILKLKFWNWLNVIYSPYRWKTCFSRNEVSSLAEILGKNVFHLYRKQSLKFCERGSSTFVCYW